MFKCKRCGNCCRWEGPVKVTEQEVDEIAGFLQIPLEDFIENHTRLAPDRRYLSLCENSNGECEFLIKEQSEWACAIETVKPQQCRNFPNKWNFPGWQNLCSGGKKE